MFQAAATNHFTWNCCVGGGSSTSRGQLFGIGCTLDAKHVLTANHIWAEINHRYEWPTVLRRDGGFRCEVAFKSPQHDIMILRATEQMSDGVSDSIVTYPTFAREPISLGSSVGFMSRLRLHRTIDDVASYTHFAFGTVAMNMPSEDGHAPQFALSSTVSQQGFSGSPVFRPDGSIVGVLTGGLSFCADFQDDSAPIHRLPLVSPVYSVLQQLLTSIGT
jgi:hypothetical protein